MGACCQLAVAGRALSLLTGSHQSTPLQQEERKKGGGAGGTGMAHQMPSRGALAGVKQDLARAKEGGSSYDPRGTGAAWTHNFLNQKPWHPSNFRNRMKTWENEQKHIADTKEKEKAQAEFDAEQEYLQTLSFLSPEQQQRYKDRQSISFMYQKPPGYDAALARDKEAEEKKKRDEEAAAAGGQALVAAGSAAAGGAGPSTSAAAAAASKPGVPSAAPAAPPGVDMDKIRLDPFKTMLAAKAALHANERFSLKTIEGTHGGFGRGAENQQMLDDDDDMAPGAGPNEEQVDEAALLASLSEEDRARVLKRLAKLQEKQAKEEQLREAEAVLRAAGYNLDSLPRGDRSSSSDSSSSSSSDSSGESGGGAREGKLGGEGRKGKKKSKTSGKKRKHGKSKKSKKGKKHKRHK